MPLKHPIVIDTSVFISALLTPNRHPQTVIDCALAEDLLVFSKETFAELKLKLHGKKLSKLIPNQIRNKALSDFFMGAHWVKIHGRVKDCHDPSDNMFLETALNSDASHIISLDAHLTSMNPWRDIEILRPADFVKLINSP